MNYKISDKVFVTVLMSVYGEKEIWLREAVESILGQTFSNFEFIIILDKPDNDFLWNILKEYELADNRIILLKNTSNIGLAASLNRGIVISRGDYIVRMDADDISVPERIETLVYFMENNVEIGVCSSWMRSFGGKFWKNRIEKYPTDHIRLETDALYKTPISHGACIIRSKMIAEFSPLYNEKCYSTQDYELFSRLMQNGVFFATLPKTLYLRRVCESLGIEPIPYRIIHNQVERGNIQTFLKRYSYKLPDIISEIDIKSLSDIFRNEKGKFHKERLGIILFLFYMSISDKSGRRLMLVLKNGDISIFKYVPFMLTVKFMIPFSYNSYNINNICTDSSLSIL